MKQNLILILGFVFFSFYLYGQTWIPDVAVLPVPDNEGYIHAPEGHYNVWRDNGLLRIGHKVRFDNIRIYSQSGDTIIITGSYPSVTLQDIVPNEFINVSVILWATVSEVSTYSLRLQLDKIQTVTGNRNWTPGTVALPVPDNEGYLHAPEGQYNVWRDNRLITRGQKIRFDDIRIYSQSGDSIIITGSYPSVTLQDIVPKDFINVPVILWATVSEVSTYSSKLQLDKIQTITGNRIWTPGIVALPEPDNEGYLHAPEGQYNVWRDNRLITRGQKIRFDDIRIYSQSGDSIIITGSYPSVTLQDIVPKDFINVPVILWATVSEVSTYSSKLQLDKIQTVTGNRIWTPGTVVLPEPDNEGYFHAPEGQYNIWRDNRLITRGQKVRFDNIRIYSQSGDSIIITGNYPSVTLRDIVPNDFINVPVILWATVSEVSTYSSKLRLDKLEIIGRNFIWIPNWN